MRWSNATALRRLSLLLAAGVARSRTAPSSFMGLTQRTRAQTPGEARRVEQVAKDMAAFVATRTGSKPVAFLKLMTKAGNAIDPGQASMLGLVNDTVRRPHEPKKRKTR
jgi:hypothetical protein